MRNLIFATLFMTLMVAVTLGQQNSTASDSGAPRTIIPRTSTLDNDNSPDAALGLPPLPKTPVTLIGGRVTHIDRVRNRLTVQPFGGKKMKIDFDERTHIYREGAETTQLGIRKGDRVYVDTQLDSTHVFARNIRVENEPNLADARGQIIRFDPEHGRLILRDELTSQPVTFEMAKDATVSGKGRSLDDLKAGALVNVHFSSEGEDRGVADEVFITAAPGETFTFAGKLLYLDLSRGLFAVQNNTDKKTYEIRFDPASREARSLSVGSDVVVSATFEGDGYKATTIDLNKTRAE